MHMHHIVCIKAFLTNFTAKTIKMIKSSAMTDHKVLGQSGWTRGGWRNRSCCTIVFWQWGEFTDQCCSHWSSIFYLTGQLNRSQPVYQLLFNCIETWLVPAKIFEFLSIYGHLFGHVITQTELTVLQGWKNAHHFWKKGINMQWCHRTSKKRCFIGV